jgi:4-amino-4-deoxy-L-arabinose transferase-like glycosyltransferase
MSRPNEPRHVWCSQVATDPLGVTMLLLIGAPVFLLGLGTPALYDPHESLYAEIARDMVARGDWLTPHLNDTRYLDKPPLFYWLIALSYKILGVSEFAARLPTALAGLGGILLTWAIGRHLFDGRVGFCAGIVLATSLGYWIFSRQLLPDMVFSCFTTLGFYSGLRSLETVRPPPIYTALFALSLALAVLTKGFLGLFPLVVIAGYLMLNAEPYRLKALMPFWGGLLVLVLIAPWHIIIAWQNEGYFWHYFMNEHLLRFLGRRDPVDYISLPLPVFFFILLFWLLPWTPYLALILPRHLSRKREDLPHIRQGTFFLLLWAAALLVFFATSQARLPQYSLPAMPALALLIGKGLDARLMRSTASTKGLLLATAVSLLLPAVALLIFPIYMHQYHQVGLTDQIALLIRLIFGLMVVGSGLALWHFVRHRWLVGFLSLALGMIMAFALVHQALVRLEPWRSSKGLVALINAGQYPGERLVLEVEKDDPFEYEQVAGLVFYAGLPVDLLRRHKPPKPPFPLRPGERFLLSEVAFHDLWTSKERVYLITDSFLDDEGVLGHHSPHVVIGQVGSRWVLSNKP